MIFLPSGVPEKVAGFRRNGFDCDPSEALLSGISDMDMKDIIRFYRHNVRLKPVVYVIVGNSPTYRYEATGNLWQCDKIEKRKIYINNV